MATAAGSRVFAQPRAQAAAATGAIPVDFAAATAPLPHVWEAAGSDRAVVGLRDQWRQDLVRVRRDAGIRTVRFHGLFDDEFGIAARGPNKLNFNYLDQVYDFMLDNGVRPFVELSFMPEALARSQNRILFYKGNISPPRRWEDWRDLVQAFAGHCVQRYGASEVANWKFEVWNEPNIVFWAGSQDDYFELYRHSALALKAVDRRLQIGGPATAQLAWIPDLIKSCEAKGVPLDFITTHVYPNDPQQALFGQANKYPLEQVIPRGLEQVRGQIRSSPRPNLPLLLTEWGSQNPAFILETVKSCIGLAESMSYWTFSNVFEEGGPLGLFNDSFGMLDQRGIARPALHAFTLLHRLGEMRLSAGEGPILATRRPDGSAAILVWNLVPTTQGAMLANGDPLNSSGGWVSDQGADLPVRVRLNGWRGRRTARLTQVNGKMGSAYGAWAAMGRPASPSRDQLASLRRSGELPTPIPLRLAAGPEPEFALALPPNGIALVEIDA